MLNKVQIIGRVGRDPEIRASQGGTRIANLSLAVTEKWKDKATGERKEKTEWVRVVSFNDGISGVCEQYVKKGDLLYIEGQMETRKWTDKDGSEKYVTEVILRPFKGELTMLGGKPEKSDKPDAHSAAKANGFVEDDEIPF